MSTVTNTSTNAVNKNVIIPEVYSELVREKISGKVVVSQFADVKGDLIGKPGETINFDAWQYIGDASDIAVGTAMDTANMKQSTKSATIKMVAPKGIKVNDYDNEVAFGNAIDEAASQQAVAIARKQDTDFIADAYKTPLKNALATDGVITFDELVAMLGQFGDDANTEDMACIAIHSVYRASFLKMDGFVDATKTFNAQGNGVQSNNCIGYFLGIPVVVTDRLINTTGAVTEHFVLLIKKHALAIVPKEVPFVETARDASTRTTTIFTSQYYATCLVDDAGIVLGKKTLPTA